MISIYRDAKESGKYNLDVFHFERITSLVDKRNKDVKLVKSVFNSRILSELIANPREFDVKRLHDCRDALELIQNYKTVSSPILNFAVELKNIISNYPDICREFDIHNEYEKLFEFDPSRYIDANDKNAIDKKCEQILTKVGKIASPYYDYKIHLNLDDLVETHNKRFIASNLNNSVFDNVNSRSLDKEQREAVLTNEVSNLVIAGAGSGKTLTICGKVKYLIEVMKVEPSEILLLSYSKKSADDLQEKISKINDGLTVGTFHKIGLDILKETKNKTFVVEDQYKAIIEKYFSEEIKNRPYILQKILEYYAFYLTDTKFEKKYETEGELFEDLKKSDFDTLRYQLTNTLSNDPDKRETIKKELVKSFQEMAIANWYFINGIDYIYEAPYEHDVSTPDKRQYTPDFKLPKYNIYHEHYGVDAEGKATQFGEEESRKYIVNMEWKRRLHEYYKTDCIETYSYEFENGTIFEKLENELKVRGVEFKPLSGEEILNALNSIYLNRSFKSFINLIRTFLSLYKALYRDDSAFDDLANESFRNIFQRNRARLFLDIVKDLYHYYMDYLRKEGKIDFDDMILESIRELDNTKNFKYKYIIVDEFQDISVSRMKFLKRLIEQGNSKLFAVGDDWQAIYRFSGCDLSIFIDFKDYFGDTAITRITTTHRNSQELQDIVGPFIKSNPEQIEKTIHSEKHTKNPVRIMYYKDYKYDAFLKILNLISKAKNNANILVLGRNNKDFEDIALDKRIYIDKGESSETKRIIKCSLYPNLNITYSTVHGSKGLEDDFVILINADDKRIGFPNKMEDDELLDLVLSHKSNYLYAEERRLWYVALTRTRSYVFVIANEDSPSEFLEEIKEKCIVMNPDEIKVNGGSEINCPRCKSGRLVLRTNGLDKTKFYGCSNYPYCNYRIDDMQAVENNRRCKNCGDFLIYKKGKNGPFYGCRNYPRCRHTEKYIRGKTTKSNVLKQNHDEYLY